MPDDGSLDVERAAAALAARLPDALAPLARAAYDYGWSWAPGGRDAFAALDPVRWRRCGQNPVAFLAHLPADVAARAAGDASVRARVEALAAHLAAERSRPCDPRFDPARPIAFLCAEFGLHASLPVYAGGLGVLAGDLLKEASDARVPLAGVGLLYRRGYFRQRLDPAGRQHEHWDDHDPELLPAALVTRDGRPLTVSVPFTDRAVTVQAWRVDAGGVPLYLLDTDRADNAPLDRWISARLYDREPAIRLAQYAVLGVGGIRLLRALGTEPGAVHLNEGHATLAALELAAGLRDPADDLAAAMARIRRRVVFTTHTPVPAGNETYDDASASSVLAPIADRLGVTTGALLDAGRARAGDEFCLTVLALRAAGAANGVSRRHGEVARAMWRPLTEAGGAVAPIGHVTNGVHAPTWVAAPLRDLFDTHLGDGWTSRAADPATWARVDDIPDTDLWAARCAARGALAREVRERSVTDRLARGEQLEYAEAAARTFDDGVLTLGFARRVAAYKRLHLLAADPARVARLLEGPPPLQLVLAGKAHPADEEAKQLLAALFRLKEVPGVAGRVVFLEDYDLDVARALVAGCDVWLNLPRPPLEASGTSGMKAVLNGGLHLSVLDGWWAEAYDGSNGWAVGGAGDASDGDAALDAAHAAALYDLVEHEVVPAFHERDERGVPPAWCARVKASLRTLGPLVAGGRMLEQYARDAYLPALLP